MQLCSHFSRQLTALFETSAYSSSTSSRRAPFRLRIIFLLVLLRSSLLPPCGSSTSSFTGASHLLSVSKPTLHPRFEPTAPPSFFACSRPPFFAHPVASYYSLLTCLFSLRFAGSFPTRFNRTDFRHLDTHFRYGHWNTDLFSLVTWVFYIVRVFVYIYYSDLHRIYYVSCIFRYVNTPLPCYLS